VSPGGAVEVALAGLRDPDGFAPIGDYAVIGDGRGAALVASDGSVDWWAVPRLDSPPAFSGLLDPVLGGRLELRPTDPDAVCTRRYVPHTNVLETTYRTGKGVVRVTDSMNSGTAGELPWGELARRVEGVEGSVPMRLVVCPGDGMRAWEPWIEDDSRGRVLHAGTLTMGLRCSEQITLRVGPDQVEGSFTAKAGDRLMVGVVVSDDQPLFLCDVESIDGRLDLSVEAWRLRPDRCRPRG